MRDYAEISKALRCCRLTSERGCAECPFSLNSNEKCANLLPDAADAIEELLAAVPKWISVEERLPEEYKDVLCYCEYFRYGDYNCMFRAIDRGYYGNGRWCGEAGQGHKNKVLAWMPLPESPKEVQDA